MTRLMTLAAENGFSHWVEVSMTALVPRADVRDMCRADRCGKYGASWACPPGCGTLEQAAADMARCSSGLRGQVCQDTFCGFSKLNDLSVKKPPKTSCLHIS